MPKTTTNTYRRLVRLRVKRRRLDRRIAILERRMAGRKAAWGNCSGHKNRKA